MCRPPLVNHKEHSLSESAVSNTEALLPPFPSPTCSKPVNTIIRTSHSHPEVMTDETQSQSVLIPREDGYTVYSQ